MPTDLFTLGIARAWHRLKPLNWFRRHITLKMRRRTMRTDPDNSGEGWGGWSRLKQERKFIHKKKERN